MKSARTPPILHVIVLAAGRSSRFGAPKQLADIDGSPMLVRAVDQVTRIISPDAVTVVLGAHASRIAPLLRAAAVSIAINPDFEQGIASSIRTGLANTPAGTCGVLIVLADQIAVTSEDLRQLVSCWQRQPDRIVAAEYRGTTGAPAIFPSDVFPELGSLQGERGARALFSRHPERVVRVPMPSAAIDIDTPADLALATPAAAND